jgi:hypothetical protein
MHSHPGDAFSYGAAILFPTGKLMGDTKVQSPTYGHYFQGNQWDIPDLPNLAEPDKPFRIGPKGPARIPADGEILQPGRGGKGYF